MKISRDTIRVITINGKHYVVFEGDQIGEVRRWDNGSWVAYTVSFNPQQIGKSHRTKQQAAEAVIKHVLGTVTYYP